MTFLEFCKSFFPDAEIFLEQNGMLQVNTRRLLELEYEQCEKEPSMYCMIKPSDILADVEPGDWHHYDPSPGDYGDRWKGPEQITLSEEKTRIMKQFRLVIDPEAAEIDFDARKPYFRMRGRPVTEEQALDIIRRTDFFFTLGYNPMNKNKYHMKDLVHGGLLDNNLYDSGICSWPQGWVHPDGVIGANGVTWKYPEEDELVGSLLPLMLAFPYLDLMIGITDWNEAPPYAWDAFLNRLNRDDDPFGREDYPDFEENIVYGLWLHDGALEVMAPARAREKYAEYRRLYGGPNEDIFKCDYYTDNHIRPADFEYLKRCIRAHGFDPEEVLAGYEWDPEKGLRDLHQPDIGAARCGTTPD